MSLHHQCIEDERVVLGNILTDPISMDEIIGKLNANDFYNMRHQLIYQTMLDIYQKGGEINRLTVANGLGNDVKRAGDKTYLIELIDSSISFGHIEYHAKHVKEASLRRQLSKLMEDSKYISYSSEKTAGELIAEIDNKLMAIELVEEKGFVHVGDNLEEFAQTIRNYKDKPSGIKTGFHDLDNMIVGLNGGDLIYLGGATSMGKTAFSLQIAINIMKNHKVGYISMEMSEEKMRLRLLANISETDASVIRKGNNNHETEKALAKLPEFKKFPLWLNYSNHTMLSLQSVIRKTVRSMGIEIMFIDYLGKIAPNDSSMIKKDYFSMHSRLLKELARDLNIPIVCLAQLKRLNNLNRKPVLSDLKESGDLECDADQVWLLYRPEYYGADILTLADNQCISGMHATEVIVAKNRDGDSSSCYFATKLPSNKYTPIDRYSEMDSEYDRY